MTVLNLVESLARERMAYCLVTTEMLEESRSILNQDTTSPSSTLSEPRSLLPSRKDCTFILNILINRYVDLPMELKVKLSFYGLTL